MSGSPLHQFEVHPLISLPAIAGYDVSFTNASLFMVLTVLAVTAFFAAGQERARTSGSRGTS